ncbi:hypothetical protein [Rhizobium viscosum]|uniref:Uncharacterized protein n=1 Tax=Rhizobium viscosum TaxID=1673 RepID=A0ABR9IUP3_RHIVS|nr:hypothetical protein [Rhizobium viscosum]MBE1506910.1 hypothetical protein [Rhizobium viscosum]
MNQLGELKQTYNGSHSMKRVSSKIAPLILLIATYASPVFADDPAKPKEGAQEQTESMRDFIKANPDCREMNDQCSFCSIVDGEAECSTPQIACVKQKYQCTMRSSR